MIIPIDWPAPINIKACITTRQHGASEGAYSAFNLAAHVGDNIEHVEATRRLLESSPLLPQSSINWLNQVHGTNIAALPLQVESTLITADGAYSATVDTVCAVLTADCLPVLFCNADGSEVAAIHAGWRGLQQGILTKALSMFRAPAEEIFSYMGPAISQNHFEVGDDVRTAFIEAERLRAYQRPVREAFKSNGLDGKWQADLYQLARSELTAAGVAYVGGGELCTYRDSDLFYSYRRSALTGRMATLIWIDKP
ncbi:MAG: YfiH family protein [Flavobacteriales bacterium]